MATERHFRSSGVGAKLLWLFIPFHCLSLSLSGLTAAHFFIAELVYVILPLALGDFHVRNNSVLFLPQTQRVLNARAAQKGRENERTRGKNNHTLQGTNMNT